MHLPSLVDAARAAGASDLHLQPGMPAAIRVRGKLQALGEPLTGETLLAMARGLLGPELWPAFLERRSADMARTLQGVRCRVNALCTSRGVGLAIRLLVPFQASLERLNLHPDLRRLALATHGLVIVSGPTGSGKSSTLAALIEEVNGSERRHVVTLESPIEYLFVPRRAFVRQREVGRDTPSFEQGLRDALREDPDVLMVGEVRDPDSMRLTLWAAETGHLVLTTLHSATSAEALARIASAFPAEIQGGICAQLADALVGVVCQRLRWLPERGACAPECEVLMGTTQVRAIVRQGQFYKIATALETGGAEGCWTFGRYREWLDRRSDWFFPPTSPPGPGRQEAEEALLLPADTRPPSGAPGLRGRGAARLSPAAVSASGDGVLAIDDAEEDLDGILSELDRNEARARRGDRGSDTDSGPPS